MEEDDRPQTPPVLVAARPLAPMGVDELRAYIDALQAEAARAEAEIARKRHHRGAADAVFRLP